MRWKMGRGVKRYLAYSPNERLILIRLAIDTIRVDRWLKRDGYSLSFARALSPHPLGARIREMPVDDIVRLVDTAARWTIGIEKSCLRRSLLTVWLLRSAGVRCDLVSGVGRVASGWQGHAWVEVDGTPLRQSENVAVQYKAFRYQLSHRQESAPAPDIESPCGLVDGAIPAADH